MCLVLPASGAQAQTKAGAGLENCGELVSHPPVLSRSLALTLALGSLARLQRGKGLSGSGAVRGNMFARRRRRDETRVTEAVAARATATAHSAEYARGGGWCAQARSPAAAVRAWVVWPAADITFDLRRACGGGWAHQPAHYAAHAWPRALHGAYAAAGPRRRARKAVDTAPAPAETSAAAPRPARGNRRGGAAARAGTAAAPVARAPPRPADRLACVLWWHQTCGRGKSSRRLRAAAPAAAPGNQHPASCCCWQQSRPFQWLWGGLRGAFGGPWAARPPYTIHTAGPSCLRGQTASWHGPTHPPGAAQTNLSTRANFKKTSFNHVGDGGRDM